MNAHVHETEPVHAHVSDSGARARAGAEVVDRLIPGPGVPTGGVIGDILTKTGNADYETGWVTPASRVEEDNTRPITSAAVYVEIGNINALLATI